MAQVVFRVKGPDIRKAVLAYAKQHLISAKDMECDNMVRKAGGIEEWSLVEEDVEYAFIDVFFESEK